MTNERPILVLGSSGQLGHAFREEFGENKNVIFLTSADLNLAKTDQIAVSLSLINPRLIINCAAYTAVDKAESEPELVMKINGEAPGEVARWCKTHHAAMIHFSTDYVFDGRLDRPYLEEDPTGPLGVYGRSKLMGEQLIRQHLQKHLIFRISWVFSSVGNNFVKTMLRLGAERESLKIVSDQIGSPTYAPDVAQLVLRIGGVDGRNIFSSEFPFGTYHLHNKGETTWFDFARNIFAVAKSLELNLKAKEVLATSTAEFGASAPRPLNSRMNMGLIERTFGVDMPSWQESLRSCIINMKKPKFQMSEL